MKRFPKQVLAKVLIALYIVAQRNTFKGYTSSYDVETLDSFNSELQLKDTESAVKNKLIYLLSELKGFKFATTLVSEFKKIQSDDKTLYSSYLNSIAEIVINKNDTENVFESIYSIIISNKLKSNCMLLSCDVHVSE